MQHKIKYYYLGDYESVFYAVFGEGYLSDEQIQLLKEAKPHNLNYYVIYLDDSTNFISYYDNKDFLNITKDKLKQWQNYK